MNCGCSSMVEHQPSKLDTWVRFPSPALQNTIAYAIVAEVVTRDLAKVETAGSSPVYRSFEKQEIYLAFFDFTGNCFPVKSKTLREDAHCGV